MYIQTILINKHILNKRQAKEYVKKMGFEPLKIHETKNYYRFRIYRPDIFSKFRAKQINNKMVMIFADF